MPKQPHYDDSQAMSEPQEIRQRYGSNQYEVEQPVQVVDVIDDD